MNKLKIAAAVIAVVICAGIVAGCAKSDEKNEDTSAVTTTVSETKGAPVTGSDRLTIEDLYNDMTEEEIAQFLKDLEDLGMTTDDIINMLYGEYDEDDFTAEKTAEPAE